MTEEQFRAALTALAGDFGSWSRAEVTAACAGAGWVVTADGIDIPGLDHPGWIAENSIPGRSGAPEMEAIGVQVTKADPEEFHEFLDTAIDVWGEPSWFGGCRNVFARWRDARTFRELSLDRAGKLGVRAGSTLAFERWYERAWELEDDLNEVPFTWMADMDGPGMDDFTYGEKVLSQWDDVTDALADTLQDVHLAMLALGTEDDDSVAGPDRLVITLQGNPDAYRGPDDQDDPDDEDWTTVDPELKVQIALYPDSVTLAVSERPEWRAELKAKAFNPGQDGVQVRQLPDDRASLIEVAELTVHFLRRFGFTSPEHVAHDSWRFPSPFDFFTLTCVGFFEAESAEEQD
ncbi:hypothetical protein ACWDOP_15290 [Nocardia sp. NPDC003693]